MKKILFALALLLSTFCNAQTATIAAGSDGYVLINGQPYKRGDLRAYYTYRTNDSGLAIIYSSDRIALLKYTVDTNYLYADSSNKKARNMGTLRTWFNTNFEYKP